VQVVAPDSRAKADLPGIVGEDGAALPWPRAVLRFAVACVSLGAFGLGFVWCLFDARKRGWHDIAVRSVLVRLQK